MTRRTRRPLDGITDDRKFEELILYVAERSQADETFGAVRLQKTLFRADFRAFALLGKSITGQMYQRLGNGAAALDYKPAETRLIDANAAVVEPRGQQKRVVPLRKAKMTRFSDAEIEIADEAIKFFYGKTAKQSSDWAHEFVGWRVAEDKERIPYETIFLANPRPLTVKEQERAGMLAEAIRE